MIPKLFFGSFVPTLADYSVPPERLLSSLPEFFTYASVRAIATAEAFYSKLTGKEAKWGNTGGIGRGSINEIPNILIVAALIVGFVRSVSVFLWEDRGADLHNVLPLWGFGFVMIGMYLPFVRVSIQEVRDRTVPPPPPPPSSSPHPPSLLFASSCSAGLTASLARQFLGYQYTSFYGDLVLHWAASPLIMIFVVVLAQAEKGNDDAY